MSTYIIYMRYILFALLVTVPVFLFQLLYILHLPLTPKFFLLPTVVGILFGIFFAKNRLQQNIIEQQKEKLTVLNKSLDNKVKARTKALENNLKLLDEYKNAIDASVLVSRIDTDGDIIYYNNKSHEIFGNSAVNIYGNIADVFSRFSVDPAVIRSVQEAMDAKKSWQNTLIIRPDETKEKEIFLFTTIIPILVKTGDVIEFFAISQDQTRIHNLDLENSKKEKMLEVQSRQAQMGEMISSIAHQWKQPLNILSLMIQDVEDMYTYKEIDDAYVKKYVANGLAQIEHMVSTMDSFRRFFIPGKQLVLFNVYDEIAAVLNLIGKHYEESKIAISLSGDNRATAQGLPNEFKQVVINILNNARDEIVRKELEDRRIAIEVTRMDDNPVVTVTDHAGGIPGSIIDRVFEAFVTTKSEAAGTGIGLHMSKVIIENSMKGVLSVINTDDGARFTIQLKHQIKEQ